MGSISPYHSSSLTLRQLPCLASPCTVPGHSRKHRMVIAQFARHRLLQALRPGTAAESLAVRDSGKIRSCVCHCAPQQPGSPEDHDTIGPDTLLGFNDIWQWRKTARELVAYGVLLAAVPLGTLLPQIKNSGAFYFVFMAIWSVYVGSHRSLQKSPPQTISLKQGLVVPIMCSVSLFGFYCLLRFFPDLDLRTFISIYLGFAGTLAVASNLVGPVGYILPETKSLSWKLVGIGAAVASRQAGAPFTLNNFIAVCIVTELLNLLSLGSFLTAAAMLGGLLLYDVFWVFGSPHVFGDNVMVKVATSTAFEGPMKLIFPQLKEHAANMYSVLGLGDIAAPGLLIALMLRFDRSRSRDLGANEMVDGLVRESQIQKPNKTYFTTCLASYMVGLAITVAANAVSGAAQPALLYLVPSLLFGVIAMASYRSEASLLLDFKDESPASKD